MRRLIPYTLLPLALLATGLASGLWLRAFPSSVMAAPLFGACVVSVLLPVAVSGLFTTRLWLTALIDAVALLLYLLVVVLRDPTGFGELWTGLIHGPSQLLTFALPLVSPHTLLVAPIALCWLGGAIAGEYIGRSWQSVLPYAAWLITFGLSYAGTARAITSSAGGRRQDTLLAACLLLVLLLFRAAQAWVAQNDGAEVTQANGVLPVRGFAIGAVLALVLAAAAAGVVQSDAFQGPPTTPQRVPSVDKGHPLTPLSFINALRQHVLDGDPAQTEFRVRLSGASSGYISIASVDDYDGDGWSFDRTFRPSGGVIPSDTDTTLRTSSHLTQTYTIVGDDLTTTPWMPYMQRASRVTGTTIDVDAPSGMIVPSAPLSRNASYRVVSDVSTADFDALTGADLPATSAPPSEHTVPGQLGAEMSTVASSFADETGVPISPAIPYLQAVSTDLRTRYALSGGPSSSPASAPSTSTTPSSHPSSKASSKPSTKPSTRSSAHRFAAGPPPSRKSTPRSRSSATSKHKPSKSTPSTKASRPSKTSHPAPPAETSVPPGARTGGTGFADVLTSILGSNRAATPEQYATLMALLARQVGVPARVVTGFRITAPSGAGLLPAGTYNVTDAQAWTWVEVPIQGKGWVVLDAAPSTYSGQRQTPSVGSSPSSSPTSTSAPNALVTSDHNGGNAVAPPSKVSHPAAVTTTTVLVLVLIGLAAAAFVIVAILVLRKRVRARRRRRVSDPRRRLLGAWHESLDVLVESGLPEVESMTSAEIAAATAERFGGGPATQASYLGEAANAAIFSPTSWVSSADADAAWSQHWLLRHEVYRRLRWRDRLVAGMRYHHLRDPNRVEGPPSWADAIKTRRTPRRRARHSGHGVVRRH